jgi:hypothetical protein
MNSIYRFFIFLDPQVRQLNTDNLAIAKSLNVPFDPTNHPISERDRLFSINFNRAHHFLAPPYSPPTPSRKRVTFDLKSLNIYPDIYLN